MAKTLFMETTEVPAARTAAEVGAELIKAGAVSINTSYENGEVTGLRWVMRINGIEALFEMPARVEPVYRIFAKRKNSSTGRYADGRVAYPDLMEKAKRVAWRQLLRWVQAQNAMIEVGMVQPAEVFFAYSVHPQSGRTLFEHVMETQFKALPPASN
jgi:hypothetical protein